MLKRKKWMVIAACAATLLPLLAGLLLWARLPERMMTHWNIRGEADGYSSRAFAVIGIPLMLLALQALCLTVTSLDKRNREQSGKVVAIVLWIVPVVSVVVCGAMLAANLGAAVPIGRIVRAVLGVLFIAIGNYLPKCRRNSTIGIRVPWTLASEAVWDATHRFAAPLWVASGALMVVSVLLPEAVAFAVTMAAVLAMAVAPILYAWRMSRGER